MGPLCGIRDTPRVSAHKRCLMHCLFLVRKIVSAITCQNTELGYMLTVANWPENMVRPIRTTRTFFAETMGEQPVIP